MGVGGEGRGLERVGEEGGTVGRDQSEDGGYTTCGRLCVSLYLGVSGGGGVVFFHFQGVFACGVRWWWWLIFIKPP